MDSWNRLLALLDTTLGFPNKIRSNVKKTWQSFDQRTGEHVFLPEYRIKVKPGIEPPEKPAASPRGLHARAVSPMGMIRELMEVEFVHTMGSSLSPRSPTKAKRATAEKPVWPQRNRTNPPASPIPSGLNNDPVDDICLLPP